MKASHHHILSLLIILFNLQSHSMDKKINIETYDEEIIEKTIKYLPLLKKTHQSALEGDFDAVKSAITETPSLAHSLYVPKHNSFIYTPVKEYKGINVLNQAVKGIFHLYTKHKHSAIVQFLLTLKVNSTLVDEKGESPLHYAAKYGSNDVLEQLLDYNASEINNINEDGRTPLHLAALCKWQGREAECISSILLLLKRGALLNKQDNNGKTPLLLATENGHCCIVELLLQNKARCDISDNDKNYPIHFAASGESKSSCTSFELLLQHGNDSLLDEKNKADLTPLGEIEKGCHTKQYWNSYEQNARCEKMKVFLQEHLISKQAK